MEASCTPTHWQALTHHRQQWQKQLRQLFHDDSERAGRYSLQAGPLFLDYSKSHLDDTTLQLLLNLCEHQQLDSAITRLLHGAEVNNTEQRPAWHTALRYRANSVIPEPSVHAEVKATQAKMRAFVEQLHNQQWNGFDGDTITDVVNIGIGGSDLGPRMVCRALSDYHRPGLKVHFVANIDGAEIHQVLQGLNPATTLFIVASKSFTTLETLENSTTARNWILTAGCPENQLRQHFVAISTNIAKATSFGIDPDNIFPMWDWVGGRYSLWSAIGLPIALAIGWQGFEELLNGAATMDEHFASAPAADNMPVILALITFWYSQFWQARSQAVLPYCHQLQRFPDFLQQLDMESLGKGVDRHGQPLAYHTGVTIWGTEESNGQHSFHQLLHQGTQMVPVDFIASLMPNHPHTHQHRELLACCLSQSQALLDGKSLQVATQELLDGGKTADEAASLAPHKVIPGNRPSNTLLMERLTPEALGALIALYEHKVYVLSVLLDINAFDQWGVELGKQLGTRIDQALQCGTLPEEWDGSTRQLAEKILSARD
nr:glucose-6-phosphate isomerase [Pseudomaricurvus sp. HS19]